MWTCDDFKCGAAERRKRLAFRDGIIFEKRKKERERDGKEKE